MKKQVKLRSKLRASDLNTFLRSYRGRDLILHLSETLDRVLEGNSYVPDYRFELIPEESYTVISRLPYPVNIKVKKGRKYLHISLKPILKSDIYEERAENLTLEQLSQNPSFHGTTYLIVDLVKDGEERLQVLGFPGSGKTFCVLKSAHELVRNTEFLPIILGYYASSQV